MASFLQTLKETFADPVEVLKLRWTNLTGNVISISIRPVKGYRPRQLTGDPKSSRSIWIKARSMLITLFLFRPALRDICRLLPF